MQSIRDINGVEWTCTDPDNLQFGRKIRDHIYEFKELNHRRYNVDDFLPFFESNSNKKAHEFFNSWEYWVEMEIDLSEYTERQTILLCSSHYSEDEVYDLMVEDPMVIAETIFEIEANNYKMV